MLLGWKRARHRAECIPSSDERAKNGDMDDGVHARCTMDDMQLKVREAAVPDRCASGMPEHALMCTPTEPCHVPAKSGELARRSSNSPTNSLLLTPLCLAGSF